MRLIQAGFVVAGLGLVEVSCAARAQVFVVGERSATAGVITEFHPTHVQLPTDLLDERGRLDLIRNLESEQGYAHRQVPQGPGIELIANGKMVPEGEDYKHELYKRGQSSGPGDVMVITKIDFKPDAIVVDFNGGPYAKHRFLSHIEINGIQLAQRGPDPYGSRVAIVFEGKGVPAVTAAEVKALLAPLVDFKARSAAEAFTNSLPEVVRDAVETHQVLVGMSEEMVIAAVGAPERRHREHAVANDPERPMVEEWIYNDPPGTTQFVRFSNGEVVRLEIAAAGKPTEIRTRRETGDVQSPALKTRTIANGDQHGEDPDGRRPGAPTLRKPGEVIDAPVTAGRVRLPDDDTKPKPIPPPPDQAPTDAPTTQSQPHVPHWVTPAGERL